MKKVLMSAKELSEIREIMATEVHNFWMEKQKAEKGWHAPEDCPKLKEFPPLGAKTKTIDGVTTPTDFKNYNGGYCDKCHSCMKPYKDLSESEKVLDRQYPAIFLKILRSKGYMIAKEK